MIMNDALRNVMKVYLSLIFLDDKLKVRLEYFQLLAMDIGGSLTKIANYSTVPVKRSVVYPAKATTEKQQQNGKNSVSIFFH